MTDELERIWKESVVAWWNIIPVVLEVLRKTTESCQYYLCCRLDSIWLLPNRSIGYYRCTKLLDLRHSWCQLRPQRCAKEAQWQRCRRGDMAACAWYSAAWGYADVSECWRCTAKRKRFSPLFLLRRLEACASLCLSYIFIYTSYCLGDPGLV